MSMAENDKIIVLQKNIFRTGFVIVQLVGGDKTVTCLAVIVQRVYISAEMPANTTGLIQVS